MNSNSSNTVDGQSSIAIKRPRLASVESPSISMYFKTHTEATEELIKTIATAATFVSCPAQANEENIAQDYLERAAIQFIRLRETQRQASFLLEEKAEAVRQRRLQIEKSNLLLQNLMYEKAYTEQEIAACKDCHLNEVAKMACEETEGVTNDPSSLSREQLSEVINNYMGADINLPSTDRQTHRNRLNFIAQQKSDRELLKQELEKSLSKKIKLERESESKRRFLGNLPSQLEVLEKATLPLQEYLKLQSSERKERFERAKKLSRPLYILCCQLVAYVDAFGNDDETAMQVEVIDAVQYEPLNKGDTSDKGSERHGAKQMTDIVSLKDALQADPFAVQLKLHLTKSNAQSTNVAAHLFETEIRFQFLPKLNIVTAEAQGNPRLLINLFPGDTGECLPNLSIYHDEALVNATSIVTGIEEKFPGRPFLWAQWLGGLMFLPDCKEHSERLEPSTKAVIRQLQRRVRAQGVFNELLSSLASRPSLIPIHPSMSTDYFPNPGPDSATLVYWSEIQQPSRISQLLPLFGYKDDKARAAGGRWCRYFRAKLQRRTDHVLTAFVEISSEYPAVTPRWLLQSPIRHDESILLASGQIPLHDNNMKLIETEVNAEYSDLFIDDEEDTFDWILVHQLRKIMACWDALFDGPDHGSIAGVRVRRGRDRRKTLAFARYANAKK